MVNRLMATVFLGLSLTSGTYALGQTKQQALAEGEWSAAVADHGGRTVRGRLVLIQDSRTGTAREVGVYVELQECAEAVGGEILWLFCDMGRSDFRPEYRPGLHCELRDSDGKSVPTEPFAFSGAVPQSTWVTLPPAATIRLRASPWGIHRRGAIALAPDIAHLWVIPNDAPREYTLEGSFTIDPASELQPPAEGWLWRGTLELPALRIRTDSL